jgi:transcriptional regulator with XRE-family HTH domain
MKIYVASTLSKCKVLIDIGVLLDYLEDVEISAEKLNSVFGSKLSGIRRSRRVSQTALGKQVGLSRTTIANLEGGLQNVQLFQVFLLARALDARPDELIPLPHEVEVETDSLNDTERILNQIRQQIIELKSGGAVNAN